MILDEIEKLYSVEFVAKLAKKDNTEQLQAFKKEVECFSELDIED
ncbi:hypothetical protein [Bacillus sp. Bos-x628]